MSWPRAVAGAIPVRELGACKIEGGVQVFSGAAAIGSR